MTAPPQPDTSHDENCQDPNSRFGVHETCPIELTDEQSRILLAVSDMHSRVTTLWCWGMSQEEATNIVKAAYEMFLVENEARVMKRKPPRTLASPERRHSIPGPQPQGPPPGVGHTESE